MTTADNQNQSNEEVLADKIAGSLLGGAVGDALGFAGENLSRERIKAKFGRITDYHVCSNWGYYTDDTQLTILLAETLLEAGGFDSAVFRQKLGRWWLVPPRLSGRSTKNAALKCLLGFKNTGFDVPGSSGAMRAAPLGIFYRGNLQELIAQTIECCKVTHVNRSAIAGALVNTISVAYALTREAFDQSDYLHTITANIQQYDADMAERLNSLPLLLNADQEVAIESMLSNSKITGSPISDIIVTAVFALLKYPTSFADSVLFCANAGWDTDTMAAIHGNIAGAWHGLKAIPAHWIERLENGYKGRDYILKLARHLCTGEQMKGADNFFTDYCRDFARNTAFLTAMLAKKPMF